jgi:hypothetical protein
MTRREKWFWVLVGVALLIGFLALIPFNGEICEKPDNTGHKECASHGLPIYVAFKVQSFLDFLGVAITAVATLAIAWFTLTLRRSTDKLWLSAKGQMEADQRRHDLVNRSYIFATPEIDEDKSSPVKTVVVLSLQNYGIAPGIVEKLHMDLALQEPNGPVASYKPGQNKFTSALLPPTQGKPAAAPVAVAAPYKEPFFVFGYVEYLDLNRTRHTSRFCAKVFPGEDGIEAAGSEAWNDWD